MITTSSQATAWSVFRVYTEVFQMAEELTSFFWEGTLMLACQGDSAGEQLFNMVELLCWEIRPFSASY